MKESTVLKRVASFITGAFGAKLIGDGFDYFFCSVVLIKFQPVIGFGIIFIAALVLNYTLVLIYDRIKIDCFGFEGVKELKEDMVSKGKKNLFDRIVFYLVKKGGIVAFIALSFYDPFIAILYKRKSSQFDGFKKEDYINLILSTAIGCFLWTLFLSLLIEPLRLLFKYLLHLL